MVETAKEIWDLLKVDLPVRYRAHKQHFSGTYNLKAAKNHDHCSGSLSILLTDGRIDTFSAIVNSD
jgi:hypothetical protein